MRPFLFVFFCSEEVHVPRLTVKACGEVNTVLQLCKFILTVLAAFGVSLVRCPWETQWRGAVSFSRDGYMVIQQKI